MDFKDKLISEFMALGDVERKDAVITLQVYLELCELKKYWDVKCEYDNNLKLLYVTGKKTKTAPTTVFLPRAVTADLNFNKMQSYFQLCQDCDVKRVFLVLVASDSTCVYYQLSDGLYEPTDLNSKQSKDDKREKLDTDIRKNRKLIEQAALYGLPITIKDSKS